MTDQRRAIGAADLSERLQPGEDLRVGVGPRKPSTVPSATTLLLLALVGMRH